MADIVTFGCRLNTYESEVMRSHADAAKLDNAIIFNTCAVTKEAERQARQAIRRARRDNPNAQIIVTGCSAQIHPDTYGGMDEVDVVLGNEEKLQAQEWTSLRAPAKQSHEIAASLNAPRNDAFGTEKVRVNDIM